MGTIAWMWAGSGPATAADRPVVVEVFTGLWCPTSYASELALDQLRSEYGRSNLVVVSYHLQDALTIPYSTSLATSYGVTNYPTAWFNGVVKRVGGNTESTGQDGIDTVYTIYKWAIDGEISRTAGVTPFTCQLAGNVGPTDPSLTVQVSSATGYPNPVNVIFLITEDNIAVATSIGLNSVSSIARAHLGTQPLTMTSAGSATLSASLTGTIPYQTASDLKPVIIIQDSVTKEIVGGTGVFDGSYEPPAPSPTPTPTASPTPTDSPTPTPTPTATPSPTASPVPTKSNNGKGGGSGGGGGGGTKGGGKGNNK